MSSHPNAVVEDIDEIEINDHVTQPSKQQKLNSFVKSDDNLGDVYVSMPIPTPAPVNTTKQKHNPDEVLDEDFDAEDFSALLGDDINYDDILELVNEAKDVNDLTSTEVYQSISHLQRCIEKNFELRFKYESEPLKFLDSELDLNEAIKSLINNATNSRLISTFVSSNSMSVFSDLLSHDNVDVGIECVTLLDELIDADNLLKSTVNSMEDVVAAQEFVKSLFSSSIMQQLIQFLPRLDETKEKTHSTCVYNIFSIVEALLDADPAVYTPLLLDSKLDLIPQLISRISYIEDSTKKISLEYIPNTRDIFLENGIFNENQLFASELLATLLQHGEALGREQIYKANGVQIMLYIIAPYRRFKAQIAEEEEFIANIFLSMIEAVRFSPQNAFILFNTSEKEQGDISNHAEVLLTFLRQKNDLVLSTLKILDACLDSNSEICQRFLFTGGLKVVSSLLTQYSTSKKLLLLHNDQTTQDMGDETDAIVVANTNDTIERILSIFVHLFTNLSDIHYLRVLHKFAEKDGEKTRSVIQIYKTYKGRIQNGQSQIQSIGITDAYEVYLRKFDYGYFTLQKCALILGLLATAQEKIIDGILHNILLSSKKATLIEVQTILQEQADNIEKYGDNTIEIQQQYIYLSGIGKLLTQIIDTLAQ